MKKHSPLLMGLVVLTSLAMVVPPDLAAQAQAAPPNQRAGEVSRMVPQVRIVRGTRQITGAPNYPVDWGDLVNTQRSGRARISLDDGSVINVGSESSLKITEGARVWVLPSPSGLNAAYPLDALVRWLRRLKRA